MNKSLYIFFVFAFAMAACTNTRPPNKTKNIIENMEKRLNAEKSVVFERDENIKNLGFKTVLNIEFSGCKNIDLMDRGLKQEIKAWAIELKYHFPNAENIDLYKIKLTKDPNDKTIGPSGINALEKGFNFFSENLK